MIETRIPVEVHANEISDRRSALRAGLEATRLEFHRRLAAVSASAWNSKSPSSSWTVREVFTHLTWALEMLPKEVEGARRGRGMFNLPKRISDPASYWYMRWLARGATPAALAQRYDQAMQAVVQLIDTIPEEDWQRGANFYAEGFHSVEDLFHVPTEHLAEHTGGL